MIKVNKEPDFIIRHYKTTELQKEVFPQTPFDNFDKPSVSWGVFEGTTIASVNVDIYHKELPFKISFELSFDKTADLHELELEIQEIFYRKVYILSKEGKAKPKRTYWHGTEYYPEWDNEKCKWFILGAADEICYTTEDFRKNMWVDELNM